MQEKTDNKKKIFWLIFLTPFIIFLLAFFSVKYQWFVSGEKINNGILLENPQHISQFFDLNLSQQIDEIIENKDQELSRKFKRNWLLLTLNFNDNCSEVCKDKLYELKQMHLSMNKNFFRLVRGYVNSSDLKTENLKFYKAIEPIYAIQTDLTAYQQKVEQILVTHNQFNAEQDKMVVLLIDPLGNIITLYKMQHSYKDIYSDIIRLLKYSQIG